MKNSDMHLLDLVGDSHVHIYVCVCVYLYVRVS